MIERCYLVSLYVQLTLTSSLCVFAAAAKAGGLDAYDPKAYFKEQLAAERTTPAAEVRQFSVYINGVKHRRFVEGTNVVDVPFQTMLDAKDFEAKATCRSINDTTMGEAQTEIKEGMAIFSRALAQTIRDKCPKGQGRTPPTTDAHLDIGVTKKDEGRKPGDTRIYNRDLQPNLFFEKNF